MKLNFYIWWIFVLVNACAALSGCLSSGALQQTYRQVESKVEMTDSILALGRPDEEFRKYLNNDKAVVFLGKQNTYLLLKGGDTLFAIAQDLNAENITVVEDSRQLFIQNRSVWGSINLSYDTNKSSQDLSKVLAVLGRTGFKTTATPGVYQISVQVQGSANPPFDFKGMPINNLLKNRTLVFRSPPTSEKTPEINKVALLPFTVAVDVLTAPLQVLGFGLMRVMLPFPSER
jgi:hypothetical protein